MPCFRYRLTETQKETEGTWRFWERNARDYQRTCTRGEGLHTVTSVKHLRTKMTFHFNVNLTKDIAMHCS